MTKTQNTNETLPTGWDSESKKTLAVLVYEALNAQNTYGQNKDVKAVLRFWERKLSPEYTIDQVAFAFDKFTDDNSGFPTVSDIKKILKPKAPQVTEAQFVEAQKWQEKNNWPMFSDAQMVIDRYRLQNKEKQEEHEIENSKISQILNKSVKKIGA